MKTGHTFPMLDNDVCFKNKVQIFLSICRKNHLFTQHCSVWVLFLPHSIIGQDTKPIVRLTRCMHFPTSFDEFVIAQLFFRNLQNKIKNYVISLKTPFYLTVCLSLWLNGQSNLIRTLVMVQFVSVWCKPKTNQQLKSEIEIQR